MTAGKNKILKWARLWVGGYDLSGDALTVGSLDYQYSELDFTGWNHAIRNYLADRRPAVGINDLQVFMNDAVAVGSEGAFTVLKDQTVLQNVSLVIGGNAEPDYGDVAYIMRGVEMTAQAQQANGVMILNAAFKPASGSTSEGIPWGQILHPKLARSITFTGTTVDQNGEIASPLTFPTTFGYKATLHIFATSSGNFAFKVEHSTNGSTWADLATFSINGSAVTSEHISSTSVSVNRYLRFSGTRTGGTITCACTFARNFNAT